MTRLMSVEGSMTSRQEGYMHPRTFDRVDPTPDQQEQLRRLRVAAEVYANTLDEVLPEGPDKTFTMRQLRTVAMWANVAVTRQADGSPR